MKKEYRIKKSDEIEQIIKNKKITASQYFVIYKMENQRNSHYKCALSISKKYGIAVNRNLMKRRVRSIVREAKINNEYDFFIVVKPSSSKLTFDEIKTELEVLLKKSNIIVEENNK